MSLKNKTILITGATRGIGAEIAKRCAKAGANVVVTGKTVEPHAKLPGTIHSVAEEVEALGGQALPLQLDVRDETAIQAVVEQTLERFSSIDILINNASAISLTPTLATTAKRYDLMQSVNTRATFLMSQACIPYLVKSDNPHILTLSPPLNLNPLWFKNHTAYTISKYGMSMCTLGLAEELREQGVAVNSLWPKTTIATAAIAVHFPPELMQASRKPSIMADAAYHILSNDSRKHTGQFFIDEEVLQAAGIEDFSRYAMNPDAPLQSDLFLGEPF